MTSFNNNSILDATSSRYIKLQIQYGGDLYELLLTSKDNQIRVEHILDEIEKLIKVPKCHQSIMYKGQRLDHQPKVNLDDLYIFNNSKLILTGRQKQIHDKYSSLDQIITSIPKSISSEEKRNLTIKSKEDINDSLIIKTQSSSVVPKKQEIHSNPIGFTPEPNKNYEYYTVPYKTDPATLLQTIPLSTSNVH